MRVLQALFLSLAIHFLFVLLVEQAPVEKRRENISVELIDSKELKNQNQIVRDHLVPEKLKADNTDDPLRFLSEKTQTVKKQTQSAVNGMTKNRGEDKPQKAEKEKSLDTNGIEAFTPQFKKRVLSEGSEAGVSTIGEAMPKEVAVGSFTALNTDRYLYYSFFARIEELIRFRWESSVQRSIDSTPPSTFNTRTNSWVTNLEIWIKPNGEYHSAHLMKESGFRGFDQAAVQAFIQAGVFPNPPKEMIESDGLIKLKYTFRVYHKPTLLGRGNN